MKFARGNLFAGLLLIVGASGCAEPPLDYTEVRRIEEQITEQEVKSYLVLAQRFPEQTLPDFPAVYAPPADWSPTRTLHVNELVTEELKLIIENWDVELLAQKLEKNKELQQHLKDLRMTPQQYVGLTLA